jgi:glycosyltransferase involved in cell wall biosynthesis
MRIAVVWPRPRKDRWQLGRTVPDQFPDLSDALLCLEDQGFQVTIEDSLGLPWNPLARMHEFYSGLDPLRAARVLARFRRYDAVISVGCSSAFFVVMLRRLLGLRLPIVLIDPALSYDYPRRKRLQDRVLPHVQKVVVFGRAQLDYLRREYGDRVDAAFLHHRADTDFYSPGPAPEQSPPDQPYIFSIGNDCSRDFDTLARAVRLCAGHPGYAHRCLIHTTLPVSDPGPGVEVCNTRVSYTELRDLYRRASLVVLPLRDMLHAGGINSLLEAMATAKPVIVSRSQGILDYVADGESAALVEPGNAEALARAILQLLGSPQEAGRLGRNARKFVTDHCWNAVYTRALGALIREACGPPASRTRTRGQPALC